MRDGDFTPFSSSFRTQNEDPAQPWIRADLGAVKTIDHVDVAPETSNDGQLWSNSLRLEYSTNGTDWTQGPMVTGSAIGSYTSVSMNVQARYVRARGTWGLIIIGDVRFYGTQ